MCILCNVFFVLASKSEARVSTSTALRVVILCSHGVIITHRISACEETRLSLATKQRHMYTVTISSDDLYLTTKFLDGKGRLLKNSLW